MKNIPEGFRIAAKIYEDKNNIAAIFAPDAMKVAAVFTTNKFPAHPVLYSKKMLPRDQHKLILVNKGSANAATGSEGEKRLIALLSKAAEYTGINTEEILAASTGVIGRQIDIPELKLKELLKDISSADDIEGFSRAIMTTDTEPKLLSDRVHINGKTVTITAVAKGSGMIAPNLATMLTFILTDLKIPKLRLQRSLEDITSKTFNCLNVDGETSTNDTVFLASSAKVDAGPLSDPEEYSIFHEKLEQISVELVKRLAADGEGATKLVQINIKNAVSREIAFKAGQTISVSPLCKTAFYGCSPNWGRIISALGAAGIEFSLEEFSINLNGKLWVDSGNPLEDISTIKDELQKPVLTFDIKIGDGSFDSTHYTCDYSTDYININAGYLS